MSKSAGSLLYGLDSNNKTVFIDDSDRATVYRCPDCNCPLIIRRGEVNMHHYAHHHKYDYSKCAFRFYELSEIASAVEKRLSDKGYEVEVRFELPDGKKIIANAVVGNTVVMIKDSEKLKEEQIKQETEFFKEKGMYTVYYVNLKNAVANDYIEVAERKDDHIKVKWKKGSHRFLRSYFAIKQKYSLFFDMSDAVHEKVVPLSHYRFADATYVFNEKYNFSVDEFADYCINREEKDKQLGGINVNVSSISYTSYNTSTSFAPNTKKPDYSVYSGDPTGCDYYTPASKAPAQDLYAVPEPAKPQWNTIDELCSRDYAGIVIVDMDSVESNSKTKKYWIKVVEGKAERKNGKIIGCRTWEYQGKFHYGDPWTFKDAFARKWKLEHAKKKEDKKMPVKVKVDDTFIENMFKQAEEERVTAPAEIEPTPEAIEERAENSGYKYFPLIQLEFEYLQEDKRTFYLIYKEFNNRKMLYEDGKIFEINPRTGEKMREVPEWVYDDKDKTVWAKEANKKD